MRPSFVALLALFAVAASRPTRVAANDEALAGWFDLRVHGGTATLVALRIPHEERALTLPIIARAIQRDTRTALSAERISQALQLPSVTNGGTDAPNDSLTVPAPLDERTWRSLLNLAPQDDLFVKLLSDRNAVVLADGLMATDTTVRALLTRDRDLLRFLYRDGAGGFVVVARRLRLEGGRVVVPGGPGAEAVWERLAGSSPARPAQFIRDLVTRDLGRVAWYFDTIAGMDPERLAVAWPSTSPAARVDDAVALYKAFKSGEPQWRLVDHPYRRNFGDAWSITMLTDIADGRLVGPSSQLFWELVFSETRDPHRLADDRSPPLSMARLAQMAMDGAARTRRHKFELYRLAQRVFPAPRSADLQDIATALGAYGEYRSLLLALERMQITDAPTWAALARAARHVTHNADDSRDATAAFQAAVSLVDRLRHVRVLDAPTATRTLAALANAVGQSRVIPAVAEWLKTSLIPALPPLERADAWTGRTAYESRILQALAGPREQPTSSIEWEGLSYRVDVVEAERDRLRAVRGQLPSPGLDVAMESSTTSDLADALTALVYAAALGEPEGAISLSRDVAKRHDLGLDATPLVRAHRPWAPPEERQDSGPWRLQGSLIGVDLGLSRLALRRLADQVMPLAPTLTINDFSTLTRTIVAMVPSELSDSDRDELAASILRGRRRVRDAAGSVTSLDALAAEAGVSAVTRQLLPWIAARDSDRLAEIFALRDLMWLGRPALPKPRLDRWGVVAEGLDARRVTAMPAPIPWENFSGRADTGQITTQMPDLTLRLVEETARLKLPAVLIPALLAFAIEDYWHEVQARFADDWWCMTRQARTLDSLRIEDYVAALTGNGPLRAQ